MFRLTTKQLNRVWVATDEERDQFVKTIDRGICCFIDALLEVGKAKNFIGGVQGTATNVDIRAFDVRAVSVGTAKSEENDVLAEMRVCIKKFIGLCVDKDIEFVLGYKASLKAVRVFRVIIKVRHGSKLEFVAIMHRIDLCGSGGVDTIVAGADIDIKEIIGKTEIILNTLIGQAIGGSLMNEIFRQV